MTRLYRVIQAKHAHYILSLNMNNFINILCEIECIYIYPQTTILIGYKVLFLK